MNIEKDGLIKFDYVSETAHTTYDTVIVKADVITDKNNAKCIFRFYSNGNELPQEQREFNTIIDKHGDLFDQVYAVGRRELGFDDHLVNEQGVTLNVRSII